MRLQNTFNFSMEHGKLKKNILHETIFLDNKVWRKNILIYFVFKMSTTA